MGRKVTDLVPYQNLKVANSSHSSHYSHYIRQKARPTEHSFSGFSSRFRRRLLMVVVWKRSQIEAERRRNDLGTRKSVFAKVRTLVPHIVHKTRGCTPAGTRYSQQAYQRTNTRPATSNKSKETVLPQCKKTHLNPFQNKHRSLSQPPDNHLELAGLLASPVRLL